MSLVGDRAELGRAQQHDQLPAVHSRSPPFFNRTCAPVMSCTAIEVGIVPHEQDLVEPRCELLRVERAARQARLVPRLHAERLACETGGLGGTNLGTGQAGVGLRADRCQRSACGARLPLALVGQAALGVGEPSSRRRAGGATSGTVEAALNGTDNTAFTR